MIGVSIVSVVVIMIAAIFSAKIFVERNKEADQIVSQGEQKNNQIQSADNAQTHALTSTEVASHNTADDCWMIIDNKVYNFTAFLAAHPGGAAVMTPYCGKEATGPFNTKDKNPAVSHTNTAKSMLPTYYVGTIGQASPASAQKPINPTKQISKLTFFRALTSTSTPQNNTSNQTSAYTVAGIAGHNTTSDCWIIISSKIYNVTSYLVQHPGGVDAIAPYCGKEATQAFQSKGGRGGDHSSSAYRLLEQFSIGDSASSSANSSNVNQTADSQSQNTSSCQSGIPNSICSKYPGSSLIEQEHEDDGRSAWKINFQGQCRDIKLNSSGDMVEDKNC